MRTWLRTIRLWTETQTLSYRMRFDGFVFSVGVDLRVKIGKVCCLIIFFCRRRTRIGIVLTVSSPLSLRLSFGFLVHLSATLFQGIPILCNRSSPDWGVA